VLPTAANGGLRRPLEGPRRPSKAFEFDDDNDNDDDDAEI
jgi:hypothetical protein